MTITKPTSDKTQGVQGFGFQEIHKNGQGNSNKSSRFVGTDNPRALRVISGLLRRPMPREAVDSTAGASNGPDLISEIRDLFPLATDRNAFIKCERINFVDRDGRPCRPGVYSFTARGRSLIHAWMTSRQEVPSCQ